VGDVLLIAPPTGATPLALGLLQINRNDLILIEPPPACTIAISGDRDFALAYPLFDADAVAGVPPYNDAVAIKGIP
jgi:hypothetical protein